MTKPKTEWKLEETHTNIHISLWQVVKFGFCFTLGGLMANDVVNIVYDFLIQFITN